MDLPEHQLRLELLRWVQDHTILRRGETIRLYSDRALVSDNEAVEELLECVSTRKVVYHDRFTDLNPAERMQVEAIAHELRTRIVGYPGSETDAITDAIGIMKAAYFAPPLGDNHHNAAECPHCSQHLPQKSRWALLREALRFDGWRR